jgi:peptidoglycan L-alanyl-D-glutamate endopeptidase CwlK
MTRFVLGEKSLANLEGVHPDLAAVVKAAIGISGSDFGVHEGLRSIETQKSYFARGVSKTMNSKHLKQVDGYSHAVDLVPYLDGALRWEWPLIYPIAAAVQDAARSLSTKIRWGGVWDRTLLELADGTDALKGEVEAYARRHPGPDFLDGPHFEMIA